MTAAEMLAALGVPEPDAALLFLAGEDAAADILRRCRLRELPEGMRAVLARWTAGSYLRMAMQTGALTLEGAELGNVASIREGDTQVSYNTNDGGAARVYALADSLQDAAALSRWRRMDWEDAADGE